MSDSARRLMRASLLALVALSALALGACAAKRPVLYPNAHLDEVGALDAQADVDTCMEYATQQGAASNRGAKVATRTATSAALGAATGAAVGAITGSAGRAAAGGAAGGGAYGLVSGMLGSADPDPVFRQFVDRCLREKGYEPIGWR